MKAVFNNPTALRLGMSGTLAGKRYNVTGRAVMGMDADGERYYWNEFNLANDAGDSATLVFEETESGGEWKLFIAVEPEVTMTAAEALTKSIGDRLTIDYTSVTVSLVDESRIYFIEGKAPEGMEVGDVAHYFNAESGNTMIVVSWTDDEVEYFRGINLKRDAVTHAFGIKEYSAANLSQAASLLAGDKSSFTSGLSSALPKLFPALIGIFIAFVFILKMPSCNILPTSRSTKRISAPKSALKPGDTGKLANANWLVRSRAIVQISEVGLKYERHEYDLTSDDGSQAMLIHGMSPGADDWFYFTPLTPIEPMTPAKAAEVRVGETVNVDGVIVPIGHLFQSLTTRKDFAPDATPVNSSSDMMFGYSGESGITTLVVRWDSRSVQFLKGKRLTNREIADAFQFSK